MQIRTIVLGLKETKELAKALKSYEGYPEELLGIRTEVANCIEESANQTNYGLNILCRFTEEQEKNSIEQARREI